MKYRTKIIILLLAMYCQSFKLIDGTDITLEQIRNSGKERVVIIFSQAVACRACYGWLAEKLLTIQKKYNCKIYVLSEYKENVFDRKMVSAEVKRRLLVSLSETYIFDEKENPFLKIYKADYAPSMLYFFGKKEKYFPYKTLFPTNKLNQQVIDKIIK